jgi:ubiquinone/menaquinone biosynthesis C-methylase UbiE
MKTATESKAPISAIGSEALDSPACDPRIVRATLQDIAVSNRLLGGRAAVVHGIETLLQVVDAERELTLVDVGAGIGDVASFLAERFRNCRSRLKPIALDIHGEAARMCAQRGVHAVVACASRLPLADSSVDIVIASQLLHHFTRAAVPELLAELVRVARQGVVIADLRRARMAELGIWLASFLLRFSPVSRRDGVVSIRRGFTQAELSDLLRAAGVRAEVRRRPGYRLVAAWRV